MKKIMIIAMVALGAVVASADLAVDLSGDWNTSTNGNINYKQTAWATNGTAIMMNSGFATALLTNTQAGTGGSYQGPNLYGAFRQNNVSVPSVPTSLRAGSGDLLNFTAGSTPTGAGDFEWMYLVKKADFANGLSLSNNIGFDASCNFSLTSTVWTADAKVLRAVVQNGGIWYISSNSVVSTGVGVKTFTDASGMLWSVWDPTTETGLSGSSLDFSTTVAGSTFNDIQAVGFWGRFTDGTANPSASISAIQIGAVGVVPSGSCNLVFVNSTPSQFLQNPSVTTSLSFVVRNTGTDATNVTVSLTGNYSWLTASTATNSISLLGNGSSVTNIFSVTIASNAPGGVYADAFTLNMQGTGTDAVTSNFSAQVSLTVLNTVIASMTKTAFAADTNETDTATLTVSNNASWELSFVLSNDPSAAWLSYPSGTLTLPANTSTGITITADGSLAGGRGIYSNVLSATWLNNDSIPNPTNFSIQFDVRANPLASLAVNLSGNWNTSSSGNMNYTRPPVTTNGTAIFYDNDFSTAILTNGQAGTGGSYQGQNMYGAFRQQNDAGAPADITTLRSGSGDYLEFGANTVPAGAGEFDFMYVFKKADFYNGMNTGNIGFDSNSSFSISASIWGADAKVLRAVVQNGSTWYISQASNTVPQAGAKVIMTNAYDALWAVWDPTADISAASLSFSNTVAGSTFTDIQAAGIWGAFTDGTVNPSARIETIQIGAVAGASPATNFVLTGSVTGGHGTVSPTNATVSAGGSTNFVITADPYYRIASLTTNGTLAGSFGNNSTSTNFLWSNVQASGALVVTFTNQVANDPASTPYTWLAGYGLTNSGDTFDQAAVADQDLDGHKAWQEYIANTDPTNKASVLKAVQTTRNVVTWAPQSNRIYSVHWSTNLVKGFTNKQDNIVYPQGSYTNMSPDARVNHYQIKVRMP